MARNNALAQKVVAVKRLKIGDENVAERVLGLALREAKLLIKLSHKNIIKLEGFVEDLRDNRIWLIFPWEDHGNLKVFIASRNWEIPERISLINDVTRGVEYLHTREPPICHGDLKSGNVLVSSNYHAIIIDFGSARQLRKKPTPPVSPLTRTSKIEAGPALELQAAVDISTNTVTLTGNEYTLRWAAPELLADQEPGLWSDIWSLGWICYEVMTNSIPFENVQKDSAVIKQVIQGELPSVTDHARMSLILQLSSIIKECWSINPSKRPTAGEFRKSMAWMPMIAPDPQRKAGSGARSPELLMQLGRMHEYQDDYSSASRAYTEARDIYVAARDKAGNASALLGLANLHRYRSEYNKAIRFYTEAAQICTQIGDRRRKADAVFGLAEVHRRQNQYTQAVTYYSEALQICSAVDNKQGRVEALLGLAEMRRAEHKYSQAAKFYNEALQICTDMGNRKWTSYALCGLAEVYRAQKEYPKAMAFHLEALQVRTDVGDRNGRAYSLWGLAEVHRDQKEYSKAITLLSEAVQIYTDIGNRRDRANALLKLAKTHRDQGSHSDAARLYEQAAEAFEQLGSHHDAVEALARAARLRP